MASVITIAGEKLFAAKAQANEQLDIDTFIFANVPAQDATAPINREEGLPTDHVVHQQIVQQVGRINDNVVVYSTVLDSITGPFEFNWVGLYSSINNTLVAINHIPTTPKTKTEAGVAGNTLNRNFGIEYSGIADLTGIDVAPETWQLDFTARLQGMDKLTQQLAKDLNGADSFIDDGFKVVPRSTLNSFEVTPGVGYINGMRAELEEVVYLNVSEYPKYVYADAYFEGDASSTWAPHVITYLSTDPDKQDFIDGSGVQHYMAPLAIIKGGGEVEDLRASFTESIDTTTKNFKTIESYKAYKQELPIGKVVYIEQRQANFKVELGTELDNDKDIIASNFTGQSIHLIINNNTHVNHLGADANGESDSYPHMYRLWELMVGGKTKVFNTFGGHTYLINSPPRDSAARNIPCYFSSEGVDQLELKNGESIFKVNQIEDSGHAVLFESKGTDGLTFDNIILVGDKTRAEAGDTITALIVSYKESGSKNTTGNSVRVKNGQGVKHDGNSEDYSINWFDSTLRPEGAKIDTIKVDNSEMDFESGEPKGYAFTGAFGGDGARVKTLDVNNIHRAVFFYGAKDVKVEGGTVKNSDSTTVLLGNYGSVLDIDIKLKFIQDERLPTALIALIPYEKGTSGGESAEANAGVIHRINRIKLDLDISGSTTNNEAGVLIDKREGNGADSHIEFNDIDIKIKYKLNASRAVRIFPGLIYRNGRNITTEKILIRDSDMSANCDINLPPGANDDIVIKGCKGVNIYATYGDVNVSIPNDNAYIRLEDSVFTGKTSQSERYDCPMKLINSRVNSGASSEGYLPAINKIVKNSYLGNAYIEDKGKYDIYSNLDTSKAMSNPDTVVNKLVAGGRNSSGSNVELKAQGNPKTSVFANLYYESFTGNSTYNATKAFSVTIQAINSANSGYGVATGKLIAVGASHGDLTTGVYKLEITSVINTGGQVFEKEDFSIAATAADTLTVSCSRTFTNLTVAIQRT